MSDALALITNTATEAYSTWGLCIDKHEGEGERSVLSISKITDGLHVEVNFLDMI